MTIKKRYAIPLIIIISLAVYLWLHRAPTLEWESRFSTAPGFFVKGRSIASCADGGYILYGSIAPQSLPNNKDCYLIKVDKNGVKLWENTFGGAEQDAGMSVQETTDGGFILLGITFSTGAGSSDMYLIKVTADGSKEWERTYGGGDTDYGNSVRQPPDSGYILLGTTYSFGAGNADMYLVKVARDGTKEWQKTFGSVKREVGYSVELAQDGGYMLLGSSQEPSLKNKVYLIKTDASGNKVWEKKYGINNFSVGNSIKRLKDGGYIIVGKTLKQTTSEIYLLKIDNDGNIIWDKTFGEKGEHFASDLVESPDGGYVIAATSYLKRENLTNYQKIIVKLVEFIPVLKKPLAKYLPVAKITNRPNPDFSIIKVGEDGNLKWWINAGGEEYETALSICESDGDYIILGESYSATPWVGSVASSSSSSQMYLVKVNAP